MHTTVIGSYPKPESLKLPDWFERQASYLCARHTAFLDLNTDLDDLFLKAAKDVINEQIALEIDVITDGEVRRENYTYYLCRHLKGISFDHLTSLAIRDGACHIQAPTIVSNIKVPGRSQTTEDWQSAQSMSSVPVKATIPGPMTISDSVVDGFYHDEDKRNSDLVVAINHEIRALAAAGCKHIQIDEPVMARKPSLALSKGIQNIELCFANIPDTVEKIVHICCGYPNYLDEESYQKADPTTYFQLAPALDKSPLIDAVSIEDAHRHNDLKLLDMFQQTKVVLGVVEIASSRIESVEEISTRLRDALEHIDARRLIVAPDCGLGFLPRPVLIQKLQNMATAAKSFA